MTTAALAALCITSANAEFYDGNTLFSRLLGSEQQQMLAVGYIAGAADTLMGITICAPTNITLSQITDMVKSFLQANPSLRHKTADSIVGHVLSQAWPCEQKKKGAGA